MSFRHTGLQFMQLNTLYQLLAMKISGSPLLDIAETLLMIPDLFHWLLTGVKCNEMTEASTSQFYNPVKGDWATDLLQKFSLPTNILSQITQPGTTLGPLRPGLAAESGQARSCSQLKQKARPWTCTDDHRKNLPAARAGLPPLP